MTLHVPPVEVTTANLLAILLIWGWATLAGAPFASLGRIPLGIAAAPLYGLAYWAAALYLLPFRGGLDVAMVAAAVAGSAVIAVQRKPILCAFRRRIASPTTWLFIPLFLSLHTLPLLNYVPIGMDATMHATSARTIAGQRGLPSDHAPFAAALPFPAVNLGLPTLAATLNTGTANGNGAVLGTGAPEQVWVNVAAPGGPAPMVVADVTLFPIVSGPWLPASTTSAWVSPGANSFGASGWYTNRVMFNAPCTNVCLRGRIASDDDGYLFVNGVFVSGSGFTVWSNVNHCADFVQGPNTIEFVVHNAGGPTGFRTELEFWTQCCCTNQTAVWNTGMGNNGTTALPPGTPDPNFILVSAPTGGCNGPAQVVLPSTIPAPPWITNGPNSQWIGAGPTTYCQSGMYH